jgi:hypothetical protein
MKEGLPVKYPTANFYYDTAYKRLYNGGTGMLFYFDPQKFLPTCHHEIPS